MNNMIRKYNIGGPAVTIAIPAAGSATTLTELMMPYITSAAAKISSAAGSATTALPYVAIPAAAVATSVYGTKANQKQVEKGMMPFITNPHAALGYQQTYMSPKQETITLPSEPLVLRPEYRTGANTPSVIEMFGYKPLQAVVRVTDKNGNTRYVNDSNLYDDEGDVPDPKEPKKDEKSF